tara:strand:+ start:8232 stop:10604 length:2373 start_codon:yes stop_codon:yes gene_type:complete
LKVNTEWLKDWVEFDCDPESLANDLTILGLEVASITKPILSLDKVLVAKIIDIKPHSNADQLSLCIVDDGNNLSEVICGAKNVRKGLKVAFAPVNTILPNQVKIKKAKIRGLASLGMICSAEELCLEDKSSGILELPDDAPIGQLFSVYLKSDDYVIDIDLTPNRADCFSIYGVSREIAAHLGKTLLKPKLKKANIDHKEQLKLEIKEPKACPKYIGRVLTNINNKLDSPIWLKERLRRNGLRTINPIVDITNYVMLEIGQPLHSFDFTKIDSSVVVRFAKKNEKIKLLDSKVIELNPDTLMITDKSGPIAIAGIMGGDRTGVTNSTDSIFLESAFFSPKIIAGKARSYNLHTDASMRFERGVDFEIQEIAIEMASKLLVDITGAKCGSLINISEESQYPKREDIILREDRLETILGIKIDATNIGKYLDSLGFSYKLISGGLKVTPPSYRFDLSIEEDLIEEIARLYGYDNIPVISSEISEKLGYAKEGFFSKDSISDILVSMGYNELITYSFIDKEIDSLINNTKNQISIINPISSDFSVLRSSLWPGLINAAKENLSRQHERIKFFEIGTEFSRKDSKILENQSLSGIMTGLRSPEQWDSDNYFFDFFDAKGDVEALFSLNNNLPLLSFEKNDHQSLWPGQSSRVYIGENPVGWLGVLHPFIQKKLSFRSPVVLFSLDLDVILSSKLTKYKDFSKQPFVRRDISLIVKEAISSEEVINIIRRKSSRVIEKIVIFDLYRDKNIGIGVKSMSLGLILQDFSRTLTDDEADILVQSVLDDLIEKLDVKIR